MQHKGPPRLLPLADVRRSRIKNGVDRNASAKRQRSVRKRRKRNADGTQSGRSNRRKNDSLHR